MTEFPLRGLRERLASLEEASMLLRVAALTWLGKPPVPGAIEGELDALDEHLKLLQGRLLAARDELSILSALAVEDDQAAWDAWRARFGSETAA